MTEAMPLSAFISPGEDLSDDVLLSLRAVEQEFRVGRGARLRALRGVDLDVHQGETLGIVGESGCGKSTLLRAVVSAPRPTGGSVVFDGRDITAMDRRELAEVRPHLGFVFQDPFSALDPRFVVRDLVEEPMLAAGIGREQRRERSRELLDLVGLDPDHHGERKSGQLSGGQLQRVAIARALAVEPRVLLCDEIVSALDVSVQAQVLNLLEELRRKLGLTSLFVSHDLAIVRHVSDRVAVMYLGKVVEVGPTDDIYHRPRHPYTSYLTGAVPGGGNRATLQGELPSPMNPPSGCPFRTRCPRAESVCADVEPPMVTYGAQHSAACHFPLSNAV